MKKKSYITPTCIIINIEQGVLLEGSTMSTSYDREKNTEEHF